LTVQKPIGDFHGGNSTFLPLELPVEIEWKFSPAGISKSEVLCLEGKFSSGVYFWLLDVFVV
jgi:hypothetical protein